MYIRIPDIFVGKEDIARLLTLTFFQDQLFDSSTVNLFLILFILRARFPVALCLNIRQAYFNRLIGVIALKAPSE